MKTLMVTIQKGGQGKTMLAVHIAKFCASQGLKVLFLDLDMQANSSWTLQPHASAIVASDFCHNAFKEIPTVIDGIALVTGDDRMADADDWNKAEILSSFGEALKRCDHEFDLCIVDTPPTLGFAQSITGLLADYVIAPVTMDWYSIQGLIKLRKIIANLTRSNPKLTMLGVVPNGVDWRKPRLIENLKQVQQQFGDEILPYVVPLRDSISEALADPEMGSVWSNPKTSARVPRKVLTDLCQFLLKRMNIQK